MTRLLLIITCVLFALCCKKEKPIDECLERNIYGNMFPANEDGICASGGIVLFVADKMGVRYSFELDGSKFSNPAYVKKEDSEVVSGCEKHLLHTCRFAKPSGTYDYKVYRVDASGADKVVEAGTLKVSKNSCDIIYANK